MGEHPVPVHWLIGEQLPGVRVEQRRHLSLRRRWTPHVVWFVADQSEMEAKRDVRPLAEHSDRVRRTWTGHHETARRGHTVLDGVEDRDVHRLVHAEVVAVEDQHANVRVEAEQLRTHPSRIRLVSHPPMLPGGEC